MSRKEILKRIKALITGREQTLKKFRHCYSSFGLKTTSKGKNELPKLLQMFYLHPKVLFFLACLLDAVYVQHPP